QTKTVALVNSSRLAVEAIGRPRAICKATPRAATKHASQRWLRSFSYVVSAIRVGFVGAARPIPGIPSHVERPIGAGTSQIAAHRCCRALPALMSVATLRIEGVSPGIDARASRRLIPSRRLLPFCLTRQTPRLSRALGEPLRIGSGIIPTYHHN